MCWKRLNIFLSIRSQIVFHFPFIISHLSFPICHFSFTRRERVRLRMLDSDLRNKWQITNDQFSLSASPSEPVLPSNQPSLLPHRVARACDSRLPSLQSFQVPRVTTKAHSPGA